MGTDGAEAMALLDGAGRVVAATERFRRLAALAPGAAGLEARAARLARAPGEPAPMEAVVLPSGPALLRCERAGEQLFVRLEEVPTGVAWPGPAFRRLAEGMVHDARNALNALALHLAVAVERASRPERAADRDEVARRSLEAMGAQVARLEKMLRRYLRFASPPAEVGEVDLCELVSQAVEACGHDARRLGVRVQAELSRSSVSGPAGALAGAVLALVQRGLDCGRGGQLHIALGAQGSQAVLSLQGAPEGEGASASEVSVEAIRGALRGLGEMAEGAHGFEVRLPLSRAG